MIQELWTAVSQWPVIIQGALGSALFWLVLEAGRKILSAFQKEVDKQSSKAAKDRLLREYIYTKYTTHSGLAYYPQGYFISFSHVLRFFVTGMVFVVIALFAGGFSQLGLSIAAVGALYFFSKALSWLIPDGAWLSHTSLSRWKRIAELEQSLFGMVNDDTKKWICELESAEAAKSNKVTGANAG